MLRVVDRTVTDRRQHLPDDKKRVTPQGVRSRSSHDKGPGQVEECKNNSQKRTTPLVNREPDSDTEKRVDLASIV